MINVLGVPVVKPCNKDPSFATQQLWAKQQQQTANVHNNHVQNQNTDEHNATGTAMQTLEVLALMMHKPT
jgi:hypothetical protein